MQSADQRLSALSDANTGVVTTLFCSKSASAGVSIDVPKSTVCIVGAPASHTDVVQQAGRADRLNQGGDVWLVLNARDLGTAKSQLTNAMKCSSKHDPVDDIFRGLFEEQRANLELISEMFSGRDDAPRCVVKLLMQPFGAVPAGMHERCNCDVVIAPAAMDSNLPRENDERVVRIVEALTASRTRAVADLSLVLGAGSFLGDELILLVAREAVQSASAEDPLPVRRARLEANENLEAIVNAARVILRQSSPVPADSAQPSSSATGRRPIKRRASRDETSARNRKKRRTQNRKK